MLDARIGEFDTEVSLAGNSSSHADRIILQFSFVMLKCIT